MKLLHSRILHLQKKAPNTSTPWRLEPADHELAMRELGAAKSQYVSTFKQIAK